MPLGIELRYRGVHPKALGGLFHGKRIQHGFQCTDKGKRPRTRRDWQPNVQHKWLYSEALKRKLKLQVTTHALKRIDQAGGLDMYLLTEPAASRGSIVAEQLRNSIIQEYKSKDRELPAKEGTTSILSLVNEKLREAGLRPESKFPEKLKKRSTSSVAPPDQTLDWQRLLPVPHADIPRTARSRRKAAVVHHMLKKKGFIVEDDSHIKSRLTNPKPSDMPSGTSQDDSTGLQGNQQQRGKDSQDTPSQEGNDSSTVSRRCGSVVSPNTLSHARLLAQRSLNGMSRQQLLRKLPRSQRARLERSIKRNDAASRRLMASGAALGDGKRVHRELVEALRRRKIRWRSQIKRRNGMIVTKRGQAKNEALRRIASDPVATRILRFDWLQNFIRDMPDGPGKMAWRKAYDEYQPNVRGMMIDGTFVPASSRFGPRPANTNSIAPPPLPPLQSSTATSAVPATPSDIVRAAQSVAFGSPPSDKSRNKPGGPAATSDISGSTGQQKQEESASEIGESLRKQVLQGIESEGAGGSGLGGISLIDAYLEHGSLTTWLGAMSASTGKQMPLKGSTDNQKQVLAAMHYRAGRKFRKMRKWLSDDWLKRHIVHESTAQRYVLGNGMILESVDMGGRARESGVSSSAQSPEP